MRNSSVLPENANRELEPGEVYKPVMNATSKPAEANAWSVTWGIVMAIIFSAATTYLGLKVGQVFEAAIPIAIIAVGLSSTLRRKNALGENVIIQSIGSASGVIAAGAIFTLPALYILQNKYPDLGVNFFEIFLSSALGGVLGILFLIPFRRYFVSDMHGKYPFPEATATTQILASGVQLDTEEKSNKSSVKLLMISGLIGGGYDFLVATFGLWSETITSKILPYGTEIAMKYKILFRHNVGAALLGLGYIIGLKYATIICAGSVLSWYVFIPFLSYFTEGMTLPIGSGISQLIANMSPDEIFRNYIRQIGIGGIAMAGIIGILRSRKIITSAIKLAGMEMRGKKLQTTIPPRTQRDLPMKFIITGLFLAIIAVFLFFYFGVIPNLTIAIVALVTVILITFLFTTVAANAIAIVGTNPVSGMTLMTLILASIVLAGVGLSGTSGMVSALIIGGVVCTGLSVAGGFITDLKIGYWLGSTPAVQQQWKFLGVLVSALTVSGVMIILSKTYGFSGEKALVAPQANAMAAVIEPIMSGQPVPWMLYFSGAVIALILTLIGVPALAFALGMFIPIDLNTPLVVGGLIAWFVSNRSKNKELNRDRHDKGLLVASGLIAGGALFGVVSAVLKYFDVNLELTWAFAEHIAILPYLLLIYLVIYLSNLRVQL